MDELRFRDNYELLKSQETERDLRFGLEWTAQDLYPCLNDDTAITPFDAHYVYHTSWAARVLRQTKPEVHYDISSSIYFATIVSAFIPIKFFDYRPAPLTINNLECGQANILSLPFENDSIKSLSCMHVIEHIGLGRYGDTVDYQGDLKAISELKRVLAPNGILLFVVPLGETPKIRYNAHRIYSFDQICNYFSDLSLVNFSLLLDNGRFLLNSDPQLLINQSYACGCFCFQKPY
ncbi:MAG: hypothetical protein H6Q74_3063 [Firmicutes bacterium]|nr:hypothetical protein [Bacillota bacterium]